MDPVRDAIAIRLEEIQGKRAARVGQAGYAQNVANIDEVIAELKAAIEKIDNPPAEGAP